VHVHLKCPSWLAIHLTNKWHHPVSPQPCTGSHGHMTTSVFHGVLLQIAGDPSTGRPARLQGIFWMDGIAWPDEIICPPPAPWDPTARKITLFTWKTQSWGYYDTNPRKDKSGLFYLPSGAAFYNGGVYIGARYDIYFNEVLSRSGMRANAVAKFLVKQVPCKVLLGYVTSPLIRSFTSGVYFTQVCVPCAECPLHAHHPSWPLFA
jgi:hypothetical protein